MRVIIVDDHPVFGAGLAAVVRLRGLDDVHVFTGSEPFDEIAETCRVEPCVAILDVRLRDTNGVDLCRSLRSLPLRVSVIMLSTFDEPAIVQAARQAGAYAYLSKEAPPDEIIRLVRAAAQSDACGTIIPKRSLPLLSEREYAVLTCLGEGMSNKDIARALEISPETVKDHVQGVFTKLGVSDRLRAVNRARELGVLAR